MEETSHEAWAELAVLSVAFPINNKGLVCPMDQACSAYTTEHKQFKSMNFLWRILTHHEQILKVNL